jgi:hypothetical protein
MLLYLKQMCGRKYFDREVTNDVYRSKNISYYRIIKYANILSSYQVRFWKGK